MDSVCYDDYHLMELAIDLYVEGLSREMLIKKLLEKCNNLKKAKHFYNVVDKMLRINKDLYTKRKAEANKRVTAQQTRKNKKLERDMDDDYDYCPPLY